jgi:hypothetical protein
MLYISTIKAFRWVISLLPLPGYVIASAFSMICNIMELAPRSAAVGVDEIASHQMLTDSKIYSMTLFLARRYHLLISYEHDTGVMRSSKFTIYGK